MIKQVAEKVAISTHFCPLRSRRVIVILIVFVGLSACGANYHHAPVEALAQPPARKVSTHIVAPGETLYSIAWRYDLDYASLANANGIGANYTIVPGQKLDLNVDARRPWSERVGKTATSNKAPVKSSNSTKRSIKESVPSTTKTIQTKSNQSVDWGWPLSGKILTQFRANSDLQKGIDIRGKLGESVLSASSGTVVYAGDGLRGYGKLLIVKHNEKFLSAYAHNRRLLVKEGDLVKRGHKIAEVGSTGTDSVKLYFEIRYNGKPVDPLSYLPKNASR